MPGINTLQTPEREIAPGIPSPWNAAHVPVVFKFQRFDWNYDLTTDPGGGVSTIFHFLTTPTAFTVGQIVYIKNLNGATYNQAATILSIPSADEIEVDIPYAGASTLGIVISEDQFPNWYLQVKIERVNPGNQGILGTIAEPIFRPEPDGTIRVDLSAYLRSEGSNENTFLYYNLTSRGDYGFEDGGEYKISTKINWVGSANSYSAFPFTYYWINGAKQILDPYAGNMADYTPQIYNSYAFPDNIKFLTDFPVKTYFPGWPFSLDFIYWDETVLPADAADVFRVRESFDVNGTSIELYNAVLDKNFKNLVTRMIVEDRRTATTYGVDPIPPTAAYLDVWLDDGVGMTPPPGTTICSVGVQPLHPDQYNYHSIERGVHVGSYFRLDYYEVNGGGDISAGEDIAIFSLSDIHNQIGLNGSIQFKNLVDLLNSFNAVIADGPTFFDDLAVVWMPSTLVSFTIQIFYDDGVTAGTWTITETGITVPSGPTWPYIC